jgi:glycosyltransferase 2 family protein
MSGPTSGGGRTKRLFFLVKLLISGGLLTVLFWRVDRQAFLQSLRALPASLLVGCILLYILGYLISTARWRLLLAAEGVHVSFPRLTLIYFEGAFFSLFLPTLIGGDIVRGYAIHKLTRGHDAAVPSVLVDRLTGFAALICIALVALGAGYRRLADPHVAGLILAMGAAFVGLMLVLLNDRMKGLVLGILDRVGLGRFQTTLQGWVEAFHRYRRHRRALAQAFLLSALLQALIIVTYYFVGLGLGLNVPLGTYFVFVPLVIAVSMFPVSVAGLGVRESGVVFFFAKAGVAGGAALGMSLVWFSLSVAVSSLGGLAFLLDHHLAKRAEG